MKPANLLVCAVLAAGCARSVLVREPPRRSLTQYGTIGIVDFSSNADPEVSRYALREFQARIQSNQDGVRFKELGPQDDLLDAVASKQLDGDALRKIGRKYGVTAVFMGSIDFSEPQTMIHVTDASSGSGTAQSTLQGNIFSKLVDVDTGASIWSRSGWTRKQVANVEVGKQKGVNVEIRRDNDPHYDMVPDLVSLVTEDFRPSMVQKSR